MKLSIYILSLAKVIKQIVLKQYGLEMIPINLAICCLHLTTQSLANHSKVECFRKQNLH